MALTGCFRQLALLVAVVSLFVVMTEPAARALELQVQSQYQFFQVKPQGKPVESRGAFRTTYNLGFRRPVTPFSKIQSFLTMNSSDNNSQVGQQFNTNMVINLISQGSTYTLTGMIDRSDNRSVTSVSGGPSVVNGQTTNYNVNLLWSKPALPVVNLQYRQSRSKAASGANRSTYSANTWLTGAYYELSPFRLTFDRQQQSSEFGGSNTSRSENARSRIGLNFEQRLLDGLNFTADFSKDSGSTSGLADSASFGGTSSAFRLTATPTRSVVVTANRTFYNNRQTSRQISSNTDSASTALSLRTEIMPGLSFGLSRSVDDQSAGLTRSRNKSLSASLAAALSRDTFVTLGWSKTSFDAFPNNFPTRQQNTYISFRTPLAMDTDLNMDAGWSDSESGTDSGSKGKYAGFIVRNKSLSEMSLGLGYHWNVLDQRGTAPGERSNQSIDFDMSWIASRALGINARASYFVTGGTAISDYLSPTIDIRWEPSNRSNLILRYDFNRSRNWDPVKAVIVGQRSKGLSARFSYRLNTRSSFDISYDFESATSGGFDFERAVRAYFKTKL